MEPTALKRKAVPTRIGGGYDGEREAKEVATEIYPSSQSLGTVEINTFFLKFCLWIPPRNPVLIYRLVLWWLIARQKACEKGWSILLVISCHLHYRTTNVNRVWTDFISESLLLWLVIFWSSVGAALVVFLAIWSWQLHNALVKKRR